MSISSERTAALRDYVPEVRELTIDGKPVKPAGETWDVYNPATEEVIATVGGATTDQVDEAVAGRPHGVHDLVHAVGRGARPPPSTGSPTAWRPGGRPAAALDRQRGRHARLHWPSTSR